MKKFHIGIDIDNVIADTTESYISKFNEYFGISIKYEDITDFYHLEKLTNIPKQRVDLFIEKTFDQDEFVTKIPPVSSASEYIQSWIKRGVVLYFISARPKSIKKVTKRWLLKHGFWGKGAKLYTFDTDKNYTDIEYKTGIVQYEKIDIFIEDKKDIAEAMSVPVLLIDRPWNRGELPEHLKRVYTWDDINKFINGISFGNRR